MRIEFKGKNYHLTPDLYKDPNKLIYQHTVGEREIKNKFWNPGPGDMVLDIGAYLGSYTLPALACGATVLAFEPFAEVLNQIEIQAKLNFFAKLSLCKEMVSDKVGKKGICPDKLSSVVKSGAKELIASCTTIDEICKKVKPTLVKIDVEGGELLVLDGGKSSLKALRPRTLIECHNCYIPGIDEVVTVQMMAMGYKVTGRVEHKEYGGVFLFFE